ncbi:MAG: hypothetical protein SF052_13670 [Bacteroidia bacterium]|nr:hypothetical protein [Bacteroidia bacterium]
MNFIKLGYFAVFLFSVLGGPLTPATFGQNEILKGKQVGFYISSNDFLIPEEQNIAITQFLTIGEDRSYAGKLKAEFMIRIGWLFSEQLQILSGADSIHFLNADLPKGKAIQESWDAERNRLVRPGEPLQELDYVLVLSPFSLTTRIHKSVFIRSNRMVTDRITVRMTDMKITQFQISDPTSPRNYHICFDEQTSEKPVETYFDFYREKSPMGKYLSLLFSRWWGAFLIERPEFCQ